MPTQAIHTFNDTNVSFEQLWQYSHHIMSSLCHSTGHATNIHVSILKNWRCTNICYYINSRDIGAQQSTLHGRTTVLFCNERTFMLYAHTCMYYYIYMCMHIETQADWDWTLLYDAWNLITKEKRVSTKYAVSNGPVKCQHKVSMGDNNKHRQHVCTGIQGMIGVKLPIRNSM